MNDRDITIQVNIPRSVLDDAEQVLRLSEANLHLLRFDTLSGIITYALHKYVTQVLNEVADEQT